jgi:hypothetical protein
MSIVILNPSTAVIGPEDTIGLTLTAVSKVTGKPIPGAVISNVVWSQDTPIGVITASGAPNAYIFTPNKVGVVNITANALITTP